MTINHSFKIRLSTLTPLSIGNGQVLSPYADYVYDASEDCVYLVNKTIFEEAVNSKNLLDQYIDSIVNTFGNNRSGFNLKKFIEDQEKLGHPENIYYPDPIRCDGLKENFRKETKSMVKDTNRPFIPGSTIKGAIKTALLYHWLRKEGKDTFDGLMRKVLSVYERCRTEIEAIDSISKKRFTATEDRREIYRLKKIILKNGVSDLGQEVDKMIATLLTEEKSYDAMTFSHLRVADSYPMKPSDVIFQLTKRLHYSKRQVTIPINLEAIPANVDSRFRLSINPAFNDEALQFLNDENSITHLFSIINKFSKDNLDMEMEQLDRLDRGMRMRYVDKEVFIKYQDFLNQQYELIDNCLPSEAYLCLGFGKSFFYNSIGMLVFDWNEENEPLAGEDNTLFQKYCKLFFLGRIGQRNFPLTRLVTRQGLPLGWVKLKVD